MKPSMIHGAVTHTTMLATTMIDVDPVRTAEIDFQARRCVSSRKRSTKTGMKAAPATPPKTRSYNMLGTVLAKLYASAKGVKPKTHATTRTRRKPVARDASVPDARMTSWRFTPSVRVGRDLLDANYVATRSR